MSALQTHAAAAPGDEASGRGRALRRKTINNQKGDEWTLRIFI